MHGPVNRRFKSNLLVKRFFFLLNTACAIVIIDLISHVHYFLRGTVGSNPTGVMDVCFECFVLSGRGLCDALIRRPEESYRMCCVAVCDLETSRMMRSWLALGRSATHTKKTYISLYEVTQYLKYSTFSRCFWSVIYCTGDGCLEILLSDVQ